MNAMSEGRILEYAYKFIIANGIHALNLKKIAENFRCDLSEVYKLYKSENELLLGIYKYYWLKSYVDDIKNIEFEGSFWQFVDYCTNLKKIKCAYYFEKFGHRFNFLNSQEYHKYLEYHSYLMQCILPKFIEVINNDITIKEFLSSQSISKENFCLITINNLTKQSSDIDLCSI